jgi:hypothetical protein
LPADAGAVDDKKFDRSICGLTLGQERVVTEKLVINLD